MTMKSAIASNDFNNDNFRMSFLYEKLDEAFEDVEYGRVQTVEDAWELIDW